MAKQSGLGAGLYVGGYDVSGDTGSLSKIGSPRGVTEVTGIDKSAFERLLTRKDGGIDFSTWYNPANSHLAYRSLPYTDQAVTYAHRQTIGAPAASMVAKQINYDHDRQQDGAFPASVATVANSFGLEWGVMLTAGARTDTAATNGASLDQTTASTSFGWQAYLHVTGVTGTSVTVAIEDSADDSAWLALTGAAFTAVTSGTNKSWQRLAGGSTATVRRYVRVVTTGTFNPATFAVAFVRNTVESAVW